MLTSPWPETTCSTSARPKRDVRSRSNVDLALGPRGKVGMAAFGRRRDEAAVDVVQQRFAQAGARSDERDVAAA